MIEKFKREVYESFWKHGVVPKTSSIRFGKMTGNRIEVMASVYEIPSEILRDCTLDQLQNAVDSMPDILGDCLVLPESGVKA